MKTEKQNVIIKILGTAQDGGIPQIGCACHNCQNTQKNLTRKRFITSLALVINDNFFLFDATPDIREQIALLAKRFDWEKPLEHLAGIFLTHAHIGHYLGLVQLGFEAANLKNIPLFCSRKMALFLQQNKPWSKLLKDKNLIVQQLFVRGNLNLSENVTTFPFKIPHRNEFSDTLGYFIKGACKNLFFLPDFKSWGKISHRVFNFLHQAKIILIDGTFFNGKELKSLNRDGIEKIGHPSIVQSIEFFNNFYPEKRPLIFFIHFNHSNPVLLAESQERKYLTQNGFLIAKEGLEFRI
ncbi:pyrroloquinoline quinone biosynthesis protein PqqB [candidate division WWE3 bacterium CG06_land_8_20_14_3_00_42_16]|uniref:Pyrroloquinoline quinone biosynthesis protein PqqB n=4 Tax=Katanobacteria TaxID=422282 RepID=A0A2M7ALR0_UNCKA|nr:MAG: hypothetical protein AUJ38_03845 [bacterium CG1_02_42_9]PIU68323.1 MAG: pyrroloquinoline quinone biosynthesis protein PqqB [candidate division WWE3 bacterium CG06_land_8_20_14_3_00_42_16]PIZ43283.1 MAG: pyrroloquinoline quinone biosynthesis protein PqqB [candidate division WWE3 bacterium CG_4_10_14_0_2_um_filter_42_8]PJA37729.1 MAG: pyrroloquinoline quinone biosynthesis protein PqqB [candidate division WWE3 bacterium CG_4_9_14_3_um_filter_43_9]PJC68743.1 MAG: pyrroloquinoline quinone bi